jgi:hypothetical protein
MTQEPTSVDAPRFPEGYGVPGTRGETGERIAWSYVEEKLRLAVNYWLTTVRPGGRPHARPVDGVWVDGALCFGGSPTRGGRATCKPTLQSRLTSRAKPTRSSWKGRPNW